mgnify:CR=1 FL=1
MNQPAGDFTITFAVKGKLMAGKESRDNPSVTRTLDLNVIVLELAKKYTPVLNKKVTVDNPNNVTQVEKDKIIAIVKQENPTLPEGTTYSVDNNGNVTVTYPDSSQDKISAAYSIQKRPVITTDLTEKALTKTPIEVTAEPGSTVILYDKNNNKNTEENKTDAKQKVEIMPETSRTRLLGLRDSSLKTLEKYKNEYRNSIIYGTIAYALHMLSLISIPVLIILLIVSYVYDSVIGLKTRSLYNKGRVIRFHVLTIFTVCQVMPLIFATVIKGWGN